MKTKWIVLALLFSLAVNGSVLATAGYQWWKHRPPEEPPEISREETFRRRLDLSEEQFRKLEGQHDRFSGEMKEIREALRQKREALIGLLEAPKPDRARIDTLLDEIAALQAELQRLVVNNILQLRGVLTPEQREKLLSSIDRHLGRGIRFHEPKRPFGNDSYDRPGPFNPRP